MSGLRTALGTWWMRLLSAPVPAAAGCVDVTEGVMGTIGCADGATGSIDPLAIAIGTVTAYEVLCV